MIAKVPKKCRKLNSRLVNYEKKQKELESLEKIQKSALARMEADLKSAILQQIYKDSRGSFPHKFDPHDLHPKLRKAGIKVSLFLLIEMIDNMGLVDGIERRDGSFGIDHYYCLYKVRMKRRR